MPDAPSQQDNEKGLHEQALFSWDVLKGEGHHSTTTGRFWTPCAFRTWTV